MVREVIAHFTGQLYSRASTSVGDSSSVVPDSLQRHGLQPTRLCPWDFPGENAGVGCHFLLHSQLETQQKINIFKKKKKKGVHLLL